MENQLVYIIRGLPEPLNRSVIQALVEYLEGCRSSQRIASSDELLYLLDAASRLMIPRPEYDMSDFDRKEIFGALDLLIADDPQIWAQLLDALNDTSSPDYERLKALSPYAGQHLMFFDVTDRAAQLRPKLEASLGREILRRCDVHAFPGNSGMIIVPPEALDRLQFVDCVDIIPATV